MTDFPDSFTLTVIRHAQTPANVDGTFCGTRDLPLTPSGEAMAMRLHLNPLISPASEIWCSPYQRTYQTVEALGRALKVPKISIDRRLNERDFGAWEGRHGDDLSDVSAYRSWKGDPYYRRPPDGETGPEVLQRLLAFLGPTLQRCPRLLIITHKTPARLLAAHLAGAPVADFRALPGFHVSSVTRISGRPGQGIIVEGPSIAHLPEAWQADPDRLNIHSHKETITHAKVL
jgi:alpha-ribazole phosphatase